MSDSAPPPRPPAGYVPIVGFVGPGGRVTFTRAFRRSPPPSTGRPRLRLVDEG